MADATPDQIKSLKDLISADAPKLAALLDGPNASVAVSALGKSLLGDAEPGIEDVISAAKQADKLKIAAAEQDAQLRLRQSNSGSLSDLAVVAKAAADSNAAANANTANARERQIKMHDSTNQYLAYGVTAMFFVILVFLLFGCRLGVCIDESMKNLMYTLLGVVATGWANIIGYYFGSSASSAQKSQTISAALMQSTQSDN